MQTSFFIMDDDSSIRRILSNIIEDYQLGHVLGEADDGLQAEERILILRPEIVLADLLMPGQDGVETVRKVKQVLAETQCIMISQVRNDHMIAKAYEQGIEFFIDKPINVVEVVAVIRKVQENLQLRRSMAIIQNTIQGFISPNIGEREQRDQKGKMGRIFSDLGILGEAGTSEISSIVAFLVEQQDRPEEYQLQAMYEMLAAQSGKDAKAIEQRIRRTIAKALQNIASLGIEDFYNEKFSQYSTTLFDFKEVKQEISYIKEKSPVHGKINVKKFLAGMTYLIEG